MKEKKLIHFILDSELRSYLKIMTEFREAGFIPGGPEDVMDARNEVPLDHPLWKYSIGTDFGVAGTYEKVYLFRRSAHLRAITPRVLNFSEGVIDLKVDHKLLDSMLIYDRKSLILGKCWPWEEGRKLTEEEARTHPLWLTFADGNQQRLDKYVENTFRIFKEQGINQHDNKAMGIYIPSDSSEKCLRLRAIEFSGSSAGGAYGTQALRGLDDQ